MRPHTTPPLPSRRIWPDTLPVAGEVVDLLLRLPEDEAWKERSPLKKAMQVLIELTRECSETAHYYLRAFDKALYPELIGFSAGEVPEKLVDYVRRCAVPRPHDADLHTDTCGRR